MRSMRPWRRRVNLYLCGPMLVVSAACMSWQTVKPPRRLFAAPVAGTPANVSGDVRVTRRDRVIYVLSDATIQNDSVVSRNAGGTRIAIATHDIAKLERRQLAKWRTAMAATWAIVALVVFVGVGFAAGSGA